MALKASPSKAAETECMIAVFVKMLVDRPRHVATVNGFKRYAALMVAPSSRSRLLDDVKSLVDTASRESAIRPRAFAFRMSIRV